MAEPTHISALPIGAMIEEFRITAVLGTGSFGVVYKCENSYLDETVAIKEFLPTDLATRLPDGQIAPLSPATEAAFAWALERFLREAKTLWGLGRPLPHRNIVRVTRFRELNGSAYLFMDFESGEPLSALLKARKRLPYAQLLEILDPLLDGLERVHASNIVHRDIKPANIVIRADGSPVLIDFGAARDVTTSGERSVFASYTPLYAALEQHQDIGSQGPWTDLYGLGSTLYRCVTGTAPKSASQRLLHDPQPPASELAAGRYPGSFLAAIDWACALDPRKRPQSVAEWRQRLFAEDAGVSGLAATGGDDGADAPGSRDTGRRARTGRRATRPPADGAMGADVDGGVALAASRRRRWLFLGAGLLVVGVAVGFAWHRFGDPPWLMPPPDPVVDATGEPRPEPSAELPGLALPAAAPGRSPTATNYERLAIDHFERDEVSRGIELARLALDATPDDARLQALLKYLEGQAYANKLLAQAGRDVAEGRLEAAWSLLDEGLSQVPAHAGLRALHARIEPQVTRQRQQQADALLARAEAARAAGDLPGSLGLIADGLRSRPDHSGLLALQTLIEAEQLRNGRPAVVLAEAQALANEGEVSAALRRVSEGLLHHPDDGDLLALGEALRARLALEDEILALLASAEGLLAAADADAGIARVDAQLERAPGDKRLLGLRARLQEQADLARQQRERGWPAMIAIPAGCYRMGSPVGEPDRDADEGPQRVCVDAFQLGRHEVTVTEFGRFVDATGYRTDAERAVGGPAGCWALDRASPDGTDGTDSPWAFQPWADWRNPNKYQSTQPDDPVACVSWNDALAYADWLQEQTGQAFRLPTEAEWEYAARAETTSKRYWADEDDNGSCQHANVADAPHGWRDGFPCNDGHEWVAPVGIFRPNAWDLFDMLGNVAEWTCSEYTADYSGAERRCGDRQSQDPRVMRGGAWNSGPAAVRAAYRDRNYPEARYSFVGFRVALDGAATAERANDGDAPAAEGSERPPARTSPAPDTGLEPEPERRPRGSPQQPISGLSETR